MKQFLHFTLMILCATAQSQTIMRIYQSNGVVLQIPVNTIDSITYTNNISGNLASLITLAIGNITDMSATSGGSISNDGGSSVTQRGICWSTIQNPTTANNTAVVGTGTGSFMANLTGLTANTTYYVRAYAINSAGISYGNQLSFTTLQTSVNAGSVTDAAGNSYPVITIGTQVWMAENLRTTKYSDGSDIPVVSDNSLWASNFNNSTNLPMMCWYNNDQATNTANKFGALYNWFSINPATNENKNVCPSGWHIPTETEWTTLTTFLGGESVAGGKMKTTGTQNWTSPNTEATNSAGFSGLPGGLRSAVGLFNFTANYSYWWSATAYNTFYAGLRGLRYDSGGVVRDNFSKTIGFSIRCLKD